MDSMINSARNQQQELQSMQHQVAVLKKNVEVRQTMADAILTLLDGAMPATSPGRALGMGQKFDVYA